MLYRAVEFCCNFRWCKLFDKKHFQYTSAHQRKFPECLSQTLFLEIKAIRRNTSR